MKYEWSQDDLIVELPPQSYADPQPLDDDVLAMATVLADIIEGAEFEAILNQLESLALDEFDRISALYGPTTVDAKPIAQLQRDFGSELLTGILRNSAAEVNQIVAAGIESGMSRRDIAEMLQSRFPVEIMPDWRARLIAQTEVTRAANNASRNTYARLGRKTLQWLDGQPGACPSCSALHGKSVPVAGGNFTDPIRGLSVLHPPLHPGCRCSTSAFDEDAGEEVDLMQPSLAATEPEQFMAAGQPRDDHGKWTRGGGGLRIELSADEQRMAAYYSSAAYDMINEELRSGHELVMGKKAVPILDGAIARSSLASDTVFYRGISSDAKLRLTDKAYMSVTDDPRAAPIFGRNVMEIHAPAGSKALDMRSISNHNEGEYLLPRGTKLKQIGPKKIVQGVEVTPYAIEGANDA